MATRLEYCESCQDGTGERTPATVYWFGRWWCQDCLDGFREANPDQRPI